MGDFYLYPAGLPFPQHRRAIVDRGELLHQIRNLGGRNTPPLPHGPAALRFSTFQ